MSFRLHSLSDTVLAHDVKPLVHDLSLADLHGYVARDPARSTLAWAWWNRPRRWFARSSVGWAEAPSCAVTFVAMDPIRIDISYRPLRHGSFPHSQERSWTHPTELLREAERIKAQKPAPRW